MLFTKTLAPYQRPSPIALTGSWFRPRLFWRQISQAETTRIRPSAPAHLQNGRVKLDKNSLPKFKLGGSMAGRILGPDDSFLIQEVLNHLDAVAHLSSGTLGHWNDSATNLARLNVVE
jgi:hypothetical protein